MERITLYARREVGDALYEVLLRSPGPTRASLVLHSLPATVGVGPAAARQILESDPRFIAGEGRYDIRDRAQLAGQNFNTALAHTIVQAGSPVDIPAVCTFFAGATHRPASYYADLIAQLVARGEHFHACDNRVLPHSWLLIPEGDNEDDVVFYCDLAGNAELARLGPRCRAESLRGATPLDTAVQVIAAAGEPVSNRSLGFLVYRLHPEEYDALDLLTRMLHDERLYAAPELMWEPGAVRPAIREALTAMDRAAAATEPALAVDLAPILAEPLPPDHQGYFIEDDDLQAIYELVQRTTQPISVGDLLTEILELGPQDSQFVAAAHSVHDLLRNDPTLLSVGPLAFLGPAGVPAWVREVPAALVPVPGTAGEDVILAEAGLRPGLADKVHDPFLEDVGDDDVTVDHTIETAEETFYLLSEPHFSAGTMKLRRMDVGFFGIATPVGLIEARDARAEEYRVWVNTETGLLFGLKELYTASRLGPGSLVAITPGERPGAFLFVSGGEDDAAAIPAPRLAQLRALAATSAGNSLFALMRELMAAHPGGVRFETLHAELNVVRRTTRLQLASLLSYYQCFRPKDGQGDSWGYAPEAVAAGAVPTKERFVISAEGDSH